MSKNTKLLLGFIVWCITVILLSGGMASMGSNHHTFQFGTCLSSLLIVGILGYISWVVVFVGWLESR